MHARASTNQKRIQKCLINISCSNEQGTTHAIWKIKDEIVIKSWESGKQFIISRVVIKSNTTTKPN